MKIVVSPRGSIEYGVRAKYNLVELSIFPSYCCAAHLSVKSNNRKGGNNGNDQKGIENIFPSGPGYET